MYKLIIVDDDELIRKGLEKVIPWEQLGFTVIGVYGNALEALESMKSNPSDVILTDIRMPEMSGLELIEQARNFHSGLKAVIISGYSEFEYARQAIMLKVENYLLKPLGQEETSAISCTFCFSS
jgi:two-component system response regulator YesN